MKSFSSGKSEKSIFEDSSKDPGGDDNDRKKFGGYLASDFSLVYYRYTFTICSSFLQIIVQNKIRKVVLLRAKRRISFNDSKTG